MPNNEANCVLEQVVDGELITLYPVTKAECVQGLSERIGTEIQPTVQNLQTNINAKADSSALTTTDSRVENLQQQVNNIARLPEGSTTGDAEIVQARVGVDATNYINLKTRLDTEMNSVKEDLTDYVFPSCYDILTVSDFEFEQGSMNVFTGELSSSDTRIRTTVRKYALKGSKIILNSGYEAAFHFETDNGSNNGSPGVFYAGTYTFPKDTWFKLIIRKTDDSNINPTEISTAVSKISILQKSVESRFTNVIRNLAQDGTFINGYYDTNDNLVTNDQFNSIVLNVTNYRGKYLYLGYTPTQLIVKETRTNGASWIGNIAKRQTIPIGNDSILLYVPVSYAMMESFILADKPIPNECKYFNDTALEYELYTVDHTDLAKKCDFRVYSSYSNMDIINSNGHNGMMYYSLHHTMDGGNMTWTVQAFNTTSIVMSCINGLVLIAYNSRYAIGYQKSTGKFFKMELTGGGYTTIKTASSFTNFERKKVKIDISDKRFKVVGYADNDTYVDEDMSDVITALSDAIICCGIVFACNSAVYNNNITCAVFDSSDFTGIQSWINIAQVDTNNHWLGKKWYAYGTSITNTSNEGRYATYLAQISGMNHTNKGISGGGIGNLGAYSKGQVYNAICNTTDGKTEADIITLETGANDCNSNVPLGTIYDTGTSTLAGCLNDCIRYLQTNTNAQIIVMPSVATKTEPQAANQYYEWQEMIRRICAVNRVYFIDGNDGLGYAKITAGTGTTYTVDTIHQTNLGGYMLAQHMWSKIKDIPLMLTSIPL